MKRSALIGSLALLATTLSLDAQQTDYRFNISTPGARSLGMGGAFLALADDATAAYTNPAGLSNLTVGGPEVAIEARSWSYSTEFVESGRVSGEPSEFGIDQLPGINKEESSASEAGLSFLSVAYVFPRGLTVAAYRHQLADFSSTYETQGLFFEAPGGGTGRTPARSQEVAMEIENIGVSAAYSFEMGASHRSLSVGLGLSRYEADLALALGEFLYFSLPDNPTDEEIRLSRLPGGFYGPSDHLFDLLLRAKLVEDSATAYGYHLGVLSRFGGGGRWSLGAVYRKGPEFELDAISFSGESSRFKETVHVPDVYGIGLAHSFANGRTRVALDYDHILYSQRFDDLVPKTVIDRHEYRIKDAMEAHLGGEHIFLVIDSLFVATVRAGAFYESGHELEYQGNNLNQSQLYPRPKSDLHLAAGLGLVIKEDYQVDLAADFSERVDTISLSLVKFF